MEKNLNFYPEELAFDRETGKFSTLEKKENATPAANLSNPLFQNFLKDNPLLQNFVGKNMSKEEILMQALSSSFKKNQEDEKKVIKNDQNNDFFEEY